MEARDPLFRLIYLPASRARPDIILSPLVFSIGGAGPRGDLETDAVENDIREPAQGVGGEVRAGLGAAEDVGEPDVLSGADEVVDPGRSGDVDRFTAAPP